MNKAKIPGPDLDKFLKQTLRDDIPPEAEARMSRHFRRLKSTFDRTDTPVASDRRLWAHGMFRQEVLAFASAVLLIAGGVMHLGGNQSVLAHSIERLKMVVTVSAGLRQATSMDCTVQIQGEERDQSSYRVRWGATGITRVDMDSTGREERTQWFPDETVSMFPYARMAVHSTAIATRPREPVWQPAQEFLTPAMLARNMEKRYGLIHSERREKDGRDEFLLVGQENRQVIEIAIDARTYLPIQLKKFLLNSSQTGDAQSGFEEVRFQWNQPISPEVLAPRSQAGNP
jgi:hypothetical protein